MKKLTRAQRKMVIEHAAQECANELPDDRVATSTSEVSQYWKDYDQVMEKHWLKLMLALEQSNRDHHAAGWDELVVFIRSADELDRDPGGHMYSLGEDDTERNREFWKEHYNSTIGANIDNISYRAS